MEKAIIIGSGPAGLTAAIYLARAGFHPLVIAGTEAGGQLMFTTEVENYPGFEEGIRGPELMQRMIKQAERFGTKFDYNNALSVDFTNGIPFKISTSETIYETESAIIATGAKARRLGLESEKKFFGRGVSTCATCDGAFFKDKVVAVVGGSDSAMAEASHLTRFASKVYIIHRRDTLRASKIMADRALSNHQIEVIYNTEIKEILGDEKVTGLKLYNCQTQKESELRVGGLFLAIGYTPATEIFKGQLEMDNRGYLITKKKTQSNIPGIFIAGDATDCQYRQAITAAGDGCKAALDLQKYLEGKRRPDID